MKRSEKKQVFIIETKWGLTGSIKVDVGLFDLDILQKYWTNLHTVFSKVISIFPRRFISTK